MDKDTDGRRATDGPELSDYQPDTKWIKASDASLQVLAAIHLRIPDSGLPWLDEMIRKAERRDIAVKAMQGLMPGFMSRYGQPGYSDSDMMAEAIHRGIEVANIADAMMEEQGNQ